MKIGLVGEAPNDVTSIQHLLENRYRSPDFEYQLMLQRIHGSQLDNQKTKRILRIEYELNKPDIVIFVRDLDSTIPNKSQINKRKEYFTASNSVVDKKGIPLLHIYEIEALILADPENFNSLYNTDLKKLQNVMAIPEPKEYLKKASSNYNESQNPKIFKSINFDKALDCEYFKKFIKDFNKMISQIST